MGLLTYERTADNSGEESGFVYISRFRTVAQLQRFEIERAGASKQGSGSGSPAQVKRGEYAYSAIVLPLPNRHQAARIASHPWTGLPFSRRIRVGEISIVLNPVSEASLCT